MHKVAVAAALHGLCEFKNHSTSEVSPNMSISLYILVSCIYIYIYTYQICI